MVGFGGSGKGEDVAALIAKKNYSKAIEVIREQLTKQRNDPRLRLQLGDVLVAAGKVKEAVTILLPLADEFAKDGFAAKAISVLKKVQKLEPGRRDIDSRLASLIEQKQRLATVIAPAASGGGALEIGMELGFDAEPEPVARPAPVAPTPIPTPPPPPAPVPAAAPLRPPAAAPARASPPPPAVAEPEIQLEAAPELDLSGGVTPNVEIAPPVAAVSGAEFDLGVTAVPVLEDAPADLGLEAADELPVLELDAPAASPSPAPAPPVVAQPVVDQDLFTGEFESVEPMLEPEPTVEPEPEPETTSDPMSDSRFADELFSVLENAFPGAGESGDAGPIVPESPPGGAQIVVSPLFKDFSVEELVMVIGGLNLITFERGNVILREGDPGNSLYMLTSGSVKAFVKREGKQVPIAELEEGAFFGELSILTGKPRSATIVAKEHCELLELDRPTLDAITQTHPHVRDVLQEFANQRMPRKS
jgi:cyclic nucleotide-binding protein/tetratricopeptide repeat protein